MNENKAKINLQKDVRQERDNKRIKTREVIFGGRLGRNKASHFLAIFLRNSLSLSLVEGHV